MESIYDLVTIKNDCLYKLGEVADSDLDTVTGNYLDVLGRVSREFKDEGVIRIGKWEWDGTKGFVFEHILADEVEEGGKAPEQALYYHLRRTADSYFQAIRAAQNDPDAIDRIVSTALEAGDLDKVAELEKHLPAVEAAKYAFLSQVPEKYKTIENAVRYVLRRADRVTRYNIQTTAYHEDTIWKMYANIRASEAGANGWVLGMPLQRALQSEAQLDAIENFLKRDDVVTVIFGERRNEDARQLKGVFVLYQWGVHPEHPYMNIYVHYNV